ncbi:hypothetical protein LXA43DRAFT_1066504 [Ganoderma leucocontextum]|nr:hypothetical protein LXA43DRAFT_1066504 [Ganoderma leucocontextum]
MHRTLARAASVRSEYFGFCNSVTTHLIVLQRLAGTHNDHKYPDIGEGCHNHTSGLSPSGQAWPRGDDVSNIRIYMDGYIVCGGQQRKEDETTLSSARIEPNVVLLVGLSDLDAILGRGSSPATVEILCMDRKERNSQAGMNSQIGLPVRHVRAVLRGHSVTVHNSGALTEMLGSQQSVFKADRMECKILSSALLNTVPGKGRRRVRHPNPIGWRAPAERRREGGRENERETWVAAGTQQEAVPESVLPYTASTRHDGSITYSMSVNITVRHESGTHLSVDPVRHISRVRGECLLSPLTRYEKRVPKDSWTDRRQDRTYTRG